MNAAERAYDHITEELQKAINEVNAQVPVEVHSPAVRVARRVFDGAIHRSIQANRALQKGGTPKERSTWAERSRLLTDERRLCEWLVACVSAMERGSPIPNPPLFM